MIPFLKAVARAYASRYEDLSEFLFLFPNKRAGTFFLKYLKEEIKEGLMISPEVMPVADFMTDLSGLVVTDRLNAIFLLYDCYRSLLGDRGDAGKSEDDFEKFISWGDMILSDFSEIDMYLADASEVFANVKDYREISSDFLTEDQKSIMREYFGREDTSGAVAGFWKEFNTPDAESLVKKRFLYLWQIMGPLYASMTQRLREQGLATVGGNYKAALESLRSGGREVLRWKKIVAVGFNALSTSEAAIFRELQSFEPYAGYDDSYIDFFWDGTGPVLNSGMNSASRFLRANRKAFPSPQWAAPVMALSDKADMPEIISVGACPSNAAQAKIAGRLLSEMRGRLPGNDFREAKVAVVLPDESLLLPMLYSVPSDIPEINLTMGYSLRLTAVASFMRLLRLASAASRKLAGGDVGFYRRPLKSLLAHPLSVVYAGSGEVETVNEYMRYYNHTEVSWKEIARISSGVASMLRPVVDAANGGDLLRSIDNLLAQLDEKMKSSGGEMLKSRLERENMALYRDALRRLADATSQYDVHLTPPAVFMLADRLLGGEKVQFEGEPLSGLQVMGTLETRALDFDCLVIPSMNERIMPMRMRGRTFIPDSLRQGYGLPPSNYAESMFSYYFYRMISRASEVRLLYDARSSAGMRAGDVSRYVLQLRHLFAKDKLESENWRFSMKRMEEEVADIVKTEDIRNYLTPYLTPGSNKGLSASTLNSYRQCQAKFYYETLLKIRTDPESGEYIDAIMQGEIVHKMLQDVYLDESLQGKMLPEPVVITKDYIETLLKDDNELRRKMTRIVNSFYGKREGDELDKPLEGVAAIVASNLMRQVKWTLKRDAGLAPFKLYGVEITEHFSLPVDERGTMVNFQYRIDRLDSIKVDGRETLRIVDYKTGNIHLGVESVEQIFDDSYGRSTVFQLFFYGWLLSRRKWDGERPESIRLEIYHLARMYENKSSVPTVDKAEVSDYGEYDAEFDGYLKSMVRTIFESDRFSVSEDARGCSGCKLIDICRR